jgi:large subunit ribosomal protein L4
MTTKKTKKTKKTQVKKAIVKKAQKKFTGALPVYNSKGKEVGKFELDKELFTGIVNKGVIYQFLMMYNANQRRGTASTKTRANVSGGGKKPFKQKGTGRARAGSTRSPLWRHGGIVFGPHPRDFHYDIPKKVKKLALVSSLNSKVAEDKWIGIDSIDLPELKTKHFQAIVDALKLQGKSLFVIEAVDEKIKRVSGNIQNVTVKNYRDFNTRDVMACDTVIMTKAALDKMPERFKE